MIKYGYYRAFVPGFKRPGYIVIALDRPNKEDTDQLHTVSFAFCSPKDSFNKALGRKIASGRLEKNAYSISHRGTVSQVVEKAVSFALEKNIVPNWVQKSKKHGGLLFGRSDKPIKNN